MREGGVNERTHRPHSDCRRTTPKPQMPVFIGGQNHHPNDAPNQATQSPASHRAPPTHAAPKITAQAVRFAANISGPGSFLLMHHRQVGTGPCKRKITEWGVIIIIVAGGTRRAAAGAVV